jgi:HEAT repeat protein
MKLRSILFPTLIALAVTSTSLFAADQPTVDRPKVDEESATKVQTTFKHLAESVENARQNLARQAAAWPTAEADRVDEQRAPPAVEKLQKAYGTIVQTQKGYLREIEMLSRIQSDKAWDVDNASYDPAPLLLALRNTKDPDLADIVAPLVAKIGKNDSRAAKVLVTLARRFDQCPGGLVKALGNMEAPAALMFLVELGVHSQNRSMLVAAGNSGFPEVLDRLIELTQESENQLKLIVEVFARLTPPFRANQEPLVNVIMARFGEIKDTRLKASLISYLGQLKNPKHFAFLETTYTFSKSNAVRLAVVSAMSNLGVNATGFLIKEVQNYDNPLSVRKSCVHSLASIAARDTVPVLLELLDDPDLHHPATRALRRIAGRQVGRTAVDWHRWWSDQPEAKSTKAARDPDVNGETIGDPQKRWQSILEAKGLSKPGQATE